MQKLFEEHPVLFRVSTAVLKKKNHHDPEQLGEERVYVSLKPWAHTPSLAGREPAGEN